MKLRTVLKTFSFNNEEYKEGRYISQQIYLTLPDELKQNVDSKQLDLLFDFSSTVTVDSVETEI